MHASLNDKGRAAVVLDTGAASRGSGNAGTNKEKTVRQWFVDHDLIESVLYLPENLFYNTSDAETYRPIAEIVEELKVIEAEARETDKALGKILKQLGI
jgi:hypothetical protein